MELIQQQIKKEIQTIKYYRLFTSSFKTRPFTKRNRLRHAIELNLLRKLKRGLKWTLKQKHTLHILKTYTISNNKKENNLL